LPASIGQGSTAITAYYNQGNPQNSQVAIAIMNQFVDRASFAVAGLSPAFTLDTQPVQSRNLTYVDFLVPGMIALSIMQTGLFGVVFTFVQWKQRGILRRLMATPMRVRDFFFSQPGHPAGDGGAPDRGPPGRWSPALPFSLHRQPVLPAPRRHPRGWHLPRNGPGDLGRVQE